MSEKIIHGQICQYLDLQYPNVIYTSDASGMRLSIGLRMEAKRKRCKRYVIPDLLILHPSNGYNGLLLEVKKSRSDVYKKDGGYLKSEHLENQIESIKALLNIGYQAGFVCGFDNAKKMIDEYFAEN